MTPTLETIWNEFAERLGAFIRARVNDPATADDIRQDVFVKIQKRLGSVRDFSKLESWIYHIARNAIIDHYRARRETTDVPESLPAEPAVDDAEVAGLKASFRQMIDDLPEPYREAIVLTELEGVPQTELARRLGLSISGAKSRVQRGREMLKHQLNECCAFEFDRRGRVIECEPRRKTNCPECAESASSRSTTTKRGW
jgi:RNA polymerase sigma-70 factor, ECF subfamily